MNEIIVYQPPDKTTQIEVQFDRDSVWLTQQQIAMPFGTQRPAIIKHLNNIFKSGELSEEVVSSILEHTTKHGAIKEKIQTVSIQLIQKANYY
jgi:hypothetical protein